MKEKLTKNSGLKLVSLLCAFFVWLAVVNVANPVTTGTKEVPVEPINEQVLEKANLTYEIVGKKTAVITYRIRTKDQYKVKPSDFRAYADLSEMYDVTGAIPVKVEVVNNSDLFETAPTVKSPEVIKIQTENLQTKEFTLVPNPYGKQADGYQPGEITMSPDHVYVKGPVSQVGQISGVGIEFPIEGASSDVTGTATPVFYDANGNKLNDLQDKVKVLGGDITYTMQILKVKTIPLDFVVTGEVAQGYKYTGVETSVKNVSVAGLKSDLAGISTLTVQDPLLNIDGATSDKTCEIDLKDFLEPNITIAGMSDTVITVTLKVEPLREKTFTVNTKDITLNGRADEYSYTFGGDKAEIRVRGLKEDLDSLSTAKMNIHADVTGLGEGTYDIDAALDLDDAFEVIAFPKVTLTIAEKSPSDEVSGTAEETKAGEAKPNESKPNETKETKAAESSSAETRPAESKSE